MSSCIVKNFISNSGYDIMKNRGAVVIAKKTNPVVHDARPTKLNTHAFIPVAASCGVLR